MMQQKCVQNLIMSSHKFDCFLLKVIHLVRDPRAQLASMLRSKPTWSRIISFFKDYCDQVWDDLTMVKELPRSRYVVMTSGVIIPRPDPYLKLNLHFLLFTFCQ